MVDPISGGITKGLATLTAKEVGRRVKKLLDDSQGITALCNQLSNHLNDLSLLPAGGGAFNGRRLRAWINRAEVREALLSADEKHLTVLHPTLASCWATTTIVPEQLSAQASLAAAEFLYNALLWQVLPDGQRNQLRQERQFDSLTTAFEGLAAEVTRLRIRLTATASQQLPLLPPIVPPGMYASPTELIVSRGGVVPFAARHFELEALLDWCDTEEVFATVIIDGPGGTGKTHLAVELCKRLNDEGWANGFLPDGEILAENLVNYRGPRLIVVDYAEVRASQLSVLLPPLQASAGGASRVRVLLLVRATAGAARGGVRSHFHSNGAELKSIADSAAKIELAEAPLDQYDRARIFAVATQAFHLELDTQSSGGEVLADITSTLYELPLNVLIAAYLAVAGNSRDIAYQDDLFDALLQHEDRYWEGHSEREGLNLDRSSRRNIAALLTLADPEGEPEGASLVSSIPEFAEVDSERRHLVARYANRLYPRGSHYWNAIEPDRVGEYLVATALADQPSVLAAAISTRRSSALQRPLRLLARAALEREAFATKFGAVLNENFERLVALAVSDADSATQQSVLAGQHLGPLLGAVAQFAAADLDVLMRCSDSLPRSPNLLIGPLHLAISERIAATLRELAEANPAAYLPNLATSLNNLSVRLGELGRREEGLVAIQEATSIRRRLAEANPAAHLPDLAMSLNNLSVDLGGLGRREEGLVAIEEATSIRRRLAEANPAAHLPDLASSLNNLSVRLGELGRREEGLVAIEDATSIYRRLAEAKPAAYLPNLAASLNNLSNLLGALGRREEGLVAIEEATTIRRRLAEANPAAHLADLATSLNNLSVRLGELGRRVEGLVAVEEATTIHRQLAEANPAAHLADLATSLNNLSNLLGELGRREEGLVAIQEATTIRRRLAEANPAAYLPNLATSLNNLSNLLGELGREDDAAAVHEELHRLGK
ncbi:MAG: tetratricopeptide repeat protein [Actinomycetia bacterium]|nr:tetratricopeptide repeat protein [Actinomycetes bacterium]